MSLGKIAYEAYCSSTGNKSLVTGDPLPTWEEMTKSRPAVAAAWELSGNAVADHVLPAPLAITEDGTVDLRVLIADQQRLNFVIATLATNSPSFGRAVLDAKMADAQRIKYADAAAQAGTAAAELAEETTNQCRSSKQ